MSYGARFRRVFIMSADFAVAKNSQMILIGEIDSPAEAKYFSIVDPGDKVVAKTARFQEFAKVFEAAFGTQAAQKKILPPVVLNNSQ